MAIKHAIYRCEAVGTGSREDPYRPKIQQQGIGMIIRSLVSDANRIFFSHVIADEADLAAAELQTGIVRLSALADSARALQQWVDDPLDVLDAPARVDIEAQRIPLHWTVPTTTRKEMFRYVRNHVRASQKMHDDLGATDSQDFFGRDLAVVGAQIPSGRRSRIGLWLRRNGTGRTAVEDTDVVRDVVHAIVGRGGWSTDRLGLLELDR